MNISDGYQWIMPFMTLLVMYYALVMVHKKFLFYITKSEFSSSFMQSLLLAVLNKIRKITLFIVAVFLTLLTMETPEVLQPFIAKGFKVFLLVYLAQLATLILKLWLKKQFLSNNVDDQSNITTVHLISVIAHGCIYSIIFLLILNNLGVDITALVAGLGVGGIAVALAVQNILSDLFSSLTIVLDKPFVVGDLIRVGEFEGVVEKIGLKTTRLKSINGEHVVIGNADLLQNRIRNFKKMVEKRVVQNLGVVYQTSPEMLAQIPLWIRDIVATFKGCKFERCHLLRFLDSSLEFELVYWINESHFASYPDMVHGINLAILKKFAAENVEFAYPTRTIFTSASV